jgi:predicted CoA-substrate-specific enzyme activase
MNNQFAGIDIGSRTIELVVVDEAGKILRSLQADTGFEPMRTAEKLLSGVSYDRIMATGYGRNLFEVAVDAATVTEIKAYARGARSFFPAAQAILDIGGQDSKVIALSDDGKVRKFEMNDRCAAGTGKFLEIMAQALEYNLDSFGKEALLSTKKLTINSMCTVFAESEVTTLITCGEKRRDIARGLHAAVAQRAANMLRRVWTGGPVIFAGGVARNSCIRHLLEEAIGQEVSVPADPQMLGALGAALLVISDV